MSIVKVQSVAPVHFKVGKCHQMKKRHCMWLLSKVFTDLEKVFSLNWGCPPREAFHWWRGERSADPAVRPIVECSIGVSPGEEDIVLSQTSYIQFSSVAQACPTLCDPMNRSTRGLPVYHQLPESTQTHVHWVGDAIQPSHPLSSPSPPAFNLSQHQSFPMSQLFTAGGQVLKFQLLHPSVQWTGLVTFRMDWLDLLAVQGTLKSLIQHHSSKTSILQCSAFLIVKLISIHDHWKNHSLD